MRHVASCFGAIGSVVGFNWCARALAVVCTEVFGLVVTNFFDVFSQIECEQSADDAAAVLDEVMELLLWKLKTSVKGGTAHLSEFFVVLGCLLDLSNAHGKREIKLDKKPGRVEQISRSRR